MKLASIGPISQSQSLPAIVDQNRPNYRGPDYWRLLKRIGNSEILHSPSLFFADDPGVPPFGLFVLYSYFRFAFYSRFRVRNKAVYLWKYPLECIKTLNRENRLLTCYLTAADIWIRIFDKCIFYLIVDTNYGVSTPNNINVQCSQI